MTKQEVYDYLDENNLWHEITEHKAVLCMEDLEDIDLPHPEANAKNLFIHDKKRHNFFLITVAGEKKVDLKQFRAEHKTTPLSFCNDEELKEILDLYPGAVTPLGLINDKENKVKFFIDRELVDLDMCAAHPMDNTATVWLKTSELIEHLKSLGKEVEVIDV
ncbi:MAG: prolyl-tRNA synthetase associated domain-containing protein [Lachnospiraceae bacterium]|nr:prolyl-tRNA synthetase associated domain-containing protein [Lachnospiraceae bacterium]